MKPREFLEILHVAERLKDTTRHCTTSKGRPESVAEHSWRLSLMALLLRHEFPDVDMDRVAGRRIPCWTAGWRPCRRRSRQICRPFMPK